MVEYTETSTANVYNPGFGDYDEATKSINDFSVTNNGDSLKVLASVAYTVYAFSEKYPSVDFSNGKHICKNKIIRMGITNNLAEILQDFIILATI